MSKAEWPWWHAPTGSDDYRIRELLRAVLDLHGYYGDRDTWLWRGQASSAFNLSPGVHTRIAISKLTLDDLTVKESTRKLLKSTRAAGLDVHEGAALPDFALLAQLQHHGAATPLLDVSLDPLVALYMAVVSPNPEDDKKDGVLFAIRKPRPSVDVRPFDTRAFEDVYDQLPTDSVVMYSAPDVSDRLRIQRGHFLISKVPDVASRITINVTTDAGLLVGDTWISKRMNNRGVRGFSPATSDVAAFRITAGFKHQLRKWLEDRTGLTADFVYPTVWHQPHQETFAKSHGRLASIV